MTTTRKRREHDRLDVEFDVTIRRGDNDITAKCINISQGGMFIETDNITIGEMVTVIFELPDLPKPIETEARVCWSEREARFGVGVQFVGLRAIEVWAVNQLFQKRRRGLF